MYAVFAFYIPNQEKSIVTVIRVMYSGMDVDNQLKNITGI